MITRPTLVVVHVLFFFSISATFMATYHIPVNADIIAPPPSLPLLHGHIFNGTSSTNSTTSTTTTTTSSFSSSSFFLSLHMFAFLLSIMVRYSFLLIHFFGRSGHSLTTPADSIAVRLLRALSDLQLYILFDCSLDGGFPTAAPRPLCCLAIPAAPMLSCCIPSVLSFGMSVVYLRLAASIPTIRRCRVSVRPSRVCPSMSIRLSDPCLFLLS